ncbi:type II 3-dehydroquinate dehydratase [Mesonia sp. MT50]|uniref:3-dehydroquinate dehydratase n=1 Tax=Mesonia profundi TaxID=3070998 RepID=A0ABU0ZZ19_9FLAO|nr:type II 3-dehydroquinate dehydratase [Mesonia profundi]MDQ7916713.1 type II 3-dehydroquinate dehydratase [Mesonia profundi]
MKILILNGPNLNLLGEREPSIYGSTSFETYLEQLRKRFKEVEISFQQSNHEGVLIDYLHKADKEVDAIVLNAAAHTHTSIALADAVNAIKKPVIEVHISNVYAREAYRKHSYIAPVAKGVIAGFGLQSYFLAIQSILDDNK